MSTRSKYTRQMKEWIEDFGNNYTNRNAFTTEEINKLYKKRYGLTREELNGLFLTGMKKDINILEVGSNIGAQLIILQKMGYKNLYGIEINEYAVEFSKSRSKGINIIQGSAFDIPFKNNYFDLVFTSGLLIHISPSDIKEVLLEIHRCTSKYIWGFEYYFNKYIEVEYRGKKELLWKANFPQLYLDLFKDIRLKKEKKIRYLDNNNTDIMFILEKR